MILASQSVDNSKNRRRKYNLFSTHEFHVTNLQLNKLLNKTLHYVSSSKLESTEEFSEEEFTWALPSSKLMSNKNCTFLSDSIY